MFDQGFIPSSYFSLNLYFAASDLNAICELIIVMIISVWPWSTSALNWVFNSSAHPSLSSPSPY